MTSFTIAFHDRSVAVEAADSIAPDVGAFFALCAAEPGAVPNGRAVITEEPSGRYALAFADRAPLPGLSRGEALHKLATAVGVETFIDGPGVALQAAAVGWGEKAVLIIGPEGSGKSALTAWFIEKGFSYLADDHVVLQENGMIAGFPGPLALDPASLSHIADLPAFHAAPSVRAEDQLLICPGGGWRAADTRMRCGLTIDIRFTAGADLGLEAMSVQQATSALLLQTRKVVLPGEPGHEPLARLAESAPVLRLTYGHYTQIADVVDFLVRVAVETEVGALEFESFLRGLPRPKAVAPAPRSYPIQSRTERTFKRKLTIGMATYDDFDGVYFTLQALRLYHPEVLDDVEFIVVDNHPDGPAGKPLKDFEEFIPNYRYIPYNETYGNAVKGRVFEEAGGEFVLCMDCHILIVPGALRRLLDYFDSNPQTRDLLQGPVVHDGLKAIFTHYEQKWTGGFYGVWGTNPAGENPEAPPFDIVMQNTGLFACRRDAWPGFNPLFRGFVPEEGYLHQKFRNAGGRTLCLPFFRCVHRFRRPLAVPYPMTWEDRIRNHLIGLRELGLPSGDMEAHYRELLGEPWSQRLFDDARRQIGEPVP